MSIRDADEVVLGRSLAWSSPSSITRQIPSVRRARLTVTNGSPSSATASSSLGGSRGSGGAAGRGGWSGVSGWVVISRPRSPGTARPSTYIYRARAVGHSVRQPHHRRLQHPRLNPATPEETRATTPPATTPPPREGPRERTDHQVPALAGSEAARCGRPCEVVHAWR